MPNLYDRSYNQYTQDGDDCPPHTFSMAYGGNEIEEEERDAWDFVGMSETQRNYEEQARKVFSKKKKPKIDIPGKPASIEFPFKTIVTESQKAWCLEFEIRGSGSLLGWFPKSLCTIERNVISGPYNFMKMKLKELGSELYIKPTPQSMATVKIGTLEPCPYCGKDTGCNCTNPGGKVTTIPAPPAEIARKTLIDFIAQNSDKLRMA